MATNNFLEQLAQLDVPPPPAAFDRELHQRVNKSLTTLHLIDFAMRAMPWAMLQFTKALLGAATFTLKGRFDDGRPSSRHRHP